MQIYAPGTRIGQYEIASRPMIGGMGVVYFALDHGNDSRPVALKTFRPELLPDRAARDRFLREGTAWIELGYHPNIVPCYKIEYIDLTVFLVLELIAKEQNMPDASLRSWLIPGRPLPLEQALLFALQIARGMKYATEKIPGFVHRDLKPENILVGADTLPETNINRLRVTDFGLVKAITNSGVESRMADVNELKPNQIQFTRGVGTPLYMAPEQWKGETVGAFTDIYAFGCILFEILAGQHPAEGKTVKELQVLHLDGRFRPIPASLPKWGIALIKKCLMLKPTHRYETWYEIINDLTNAYTALSGKAAPEEKQGLDASRDEHIQAGWSYNALGVAYVDIGKAIVAIDYFEKALSLARQVGNRGTEGGALGNLGTAYWKLGDMRQALNYYGQNLAIARELGDRWDEGASLNNLGLTHVVLGNIKAAIECCSQALQISQEVANPHGEGDALGNLGNIYLSLGNMRQAIYHYEKALIVARVIGDRRGEGVTLNNLGEAYRRIGNIQMATKYYEQALSVAREIGDRGGEGNALGNLGIIYANLGDMKKATSYYDKQLKIVDETGDRRGEGNAHGNLGDLYLQVGDMRQAISHYKQALTIFREIGDQQAEAMCLGNMGNAYSGLDNVQQAIEYYEKALQINHQIGSSNGIAFVSLNMASLYAKLGDTDPALTLAQEAKQLFDQIGYQEYSQRANQLILQLQEASKSTSTQSNQVEAAIEGFLNADGPQAMQSAVQRFPFLKDEQFIRTIEGIKEQFPSEYRSAFEERLAWLRQIAHKQKPSLFTRLFGKKD